MRKNLLAIGLLAIGFSTSAQILTYVGNEALVTVTDGALVYNGGGWQVVASATDQATRGVRNMGDIMVVGVGTDKFDVAADSFVLQATDANNYGQLYINGLAQGSIAGKVNKEYYADVLHSDTGKQQLGLPFFELTLGELNALVGGYLNVTDGSLTASGRWAYNTVSKWNNAKAQFDHLSGASTIIGVPTDYVIVPHRNKSGTSIWTPTAKTIFKGVPVSDQSQTTITIQPSNVNFGSNGGGRNQYRELYNTYITDAFRPDSKWEDDYGKNLMQFANPFLTNLDMKNLEPLGFAGKVEGIMYFGTSSLSWRPDRGTTYNDGNAGMVIATTNDGQTLQAGQTESFMIKPLGEVIIKFEPNQSGSITLNPARKFASTAVANPISGNPTGKMVGASIPADLLVKQVALVGMDAEDIEVGRTYYAVAPSATTGMSPSARLQAQFDGAALYTQEETVEGTVEANSSAKLHINEANEVAYKGKEIKVVLNNEHIRSFKFLVYQGGQFVNELTNGESFYLVNDNMVTKIKHGDVVSVSGNNYSVTYGRPNTKAVMTPPGLAKKETVIAKKDKDWVVRFADYWKSANIEVYDAAGRLMHSANNISTLSDYVIPVNDKVKGILVVNAISDSGEVLTKKIVK